VEELVDARSHLLAGLARERQREDLARSRDPLVDEVGDPERQRTSLAGTRTGAHLNRSVSVEHDGELLVVQVVGPSHGRSLALRRIA
jgi:hypothetical protein